uniref:Uncharacterized protein n=1 Tax=Rhizophora mucronata TaxID=61149 RepID=A0A2P2PKC4_RHIMU
MVFCLKCIFFMVIRASFLFSQSLSMLLYKKTFFGILQNFHPGSTRSWCGTSLIPSCVLRLESRFSLCIKNVFMVENTPSYLLIRSTSNSFFMSIWRTWNLITRLFGKVLTSLCTEGHESYRSEKASSLSHHKYLFLSLF